MRINPEIKDAISSKCEDETIKTFLLHIIYKEADELSQKKHWHFRNYYRTQVEKFVERWNISNHEAD